MKRNTLIAAGLAVLIGGSLAGYGVMRKNAEIVSEVEPDIVLCYGEVNPEGHVLTESAHYFADKVKELSGGKMLIEIYPSGQMGDDARCYQALKMGALDLYRGNSMSLAVCDNPMVSVLALPYMFRDREHFWDVCNSEVGEQILLDLADGTGMIGLAYLDEGPRNFFTTDKPIKRLEDMKDLKIRMPVSDMMLDTVTALGATPVPIAYAELYTALESGTVDGAENPPVSYYFNRFYKVAPNYVKDRHTFSPGVILASQRTWNSLEQSYQDVILEAARLTQEYNKTVIEEADRKAYEEMQKAGVTVTELEDPDAWNAAMEPVYQKYGAQYLDLIREVRGMR